MASRKITLLGLVMALVIMLWDARTIAQPLDCTSVMITMASCLDYVTGSSPTPSASCCSQFANVVRSQPRCLCTALNGGASSLGISINHTLALALPDLCKVKTPPVSKCNAADGPTPAISPSGSPQGLPGNSNDTTNRDGSKIVPEGTSSGVTFEMPVQLILILLPIAFYASTSNNLV